MNEAAVALAPNETLQVAVTAADPARVRALRATVEAAGHRVVEALDDADVVLADAPFESDRVPVVVLGGGDPESAGVLAHDAGPAQIDAALRAVAAGLRVRPVQDAGFAALAEPALKGTLTPREIEVLSAIGEGLGNKAIARKLDISLHTVKFHVESIFRKLGVRSRAEAVARGLQRVQL